MLQFTLQRVGADPGDLPERPKSIRPLLVEAIALAIAGARTTARPWPQASITSDQLGANGGTRTRSASDEKRDDSRGAESSRNPHRRAWKARMRPLHHIRIGSAYGYRTRPSTMAPWDAASTPRPNRWTGPLHRPTGILQLSKTPLTSSWWAARDSNPNVPLGRSVLQTASGPSARTARVGGSARIRTRTQEFWRLRCSRYTTLPHVTSL